MSLKVAIKINSIVDRINMLSKENLRKAIELKLQFKFDSNQTNLNPALLSTFIWAVIDRNYKDQLIAKITETHEIIEKRLGMH